MKRSNISLPQEQCVCLTLCLNDLHVPLGVSSLSSRLGHLPSFTCWDGIHAIVALSSAVSTLLLFIAPFQLQAFARTAKLGTLMQRTDTGSENGLGSTKVQNPMHKMIMMNIGSRNTCIKSYCGTTPIEVPWTLDRHAAPMIRLPTRLTPA